MRLVAVLEALAIHFYTETDRTMTVVRDEFLFFYFRNSNMFELEAETDQAVRVLAGGGRYETTATLPAFSVIFCTRVSVINLELWRQNYGEYCAMEKNPNKTKEKIYFGEESFDELLEQDLL